MNPEVEVSLNDHLPNFETYLKVIRDTSKSTYKHHISQIRIILRSAPHFNKDETVEFLAGLKSRVSTGTLQNYIFTIRVFCDYLIYKGLLETNWGKQIPLPKRETKVPVILTIKEIERLLETDLASSYSHFPKPSEAKSIYDTIFSLLTKTGARVGEVLAMKVEELDLAEGMWRLEHTKTRCGRIVPIPPDDLIRIKRLVADKSPQEHVFVNPLSGGPMRQQTLGNNFRLRLKKAAIKKRATIHTLRHSFITELLKQDVSVLKIANIVGHENIKTTQDYAKLLYEDLRDAILRHPLTAKNRNPYEILEHIKQTIEGFHLKEDSRFMYNIDDSNEGIRVSIFIR